MAEKCKKSFCMKQVNPNIPNLYFGTPFERDENWGGCYLCEMGFGASYVYGEPLRHKPKLVKRQTTNLGLMEATIEQEP